MEDLQRLKDNFDLVTEKDLESFLHTVQMRMIDSIDLSDDCKNEHLMFLLLRNFCSKGSSYQDRIVQESWIKNLFTDQYHTLYTHSPLKSLISSSWI